jgi:hypothetical protein
MDTYGGKRICSDLFFELAFWRNKARVEEWKDGRLDHGARRWSWTRCGTTMEDGIGSHQPMSNERFAMGCCSAFMDDDPPFVGNDDAGASARSGQMVGLQGQLKNISYENRKPQFSEISCIFVRPGRRPQGSLGARPATWGCGA